MLSSARLPKPLSLFPISLISTCPWIKTSPAPPDLAAPANTSRTEDKKLTKRPKSKVKKTSPLRVYTGASPGTPAFGNHPPVQQRPAPRPVDGLPGGQPQAQPESVLEDELRLAEATEEEEEEAAAAGTLLACSARDGERALRSE